MRKELKFHHKKNKKQKNRLNTKYIIQETRGNKAKCILKANSKMTEVPNIFNYFKYKQFKLSNQTEVGRMDSNKHGIIIYCLQETALDPETKIG